MQGLSSQRLMEPGPEFGKIRMKVGMGTPIDSSRYEMIYELTKIDPVIMEDELEVRILQIGDHAILDQGYSDYRIDSVIWKIHEPTMTVRDYYLIESGYGNIPGITLIRPYLFYQNKWRETEMIDSKGVCTYDSTAVQDWELLDGSEIIAGMECRKARANFRGREWIVWYAQDIPYSAGPWKLGGLPGLILKAESADGEYKMEARLLRNGSGSIRRQQEHYPEIKRADFMRRYQEATEYPFRKARYNNKGKHEQYDERQFYNPIEKTLD